MTPLARRVLEKVRQKDHGTYERWVQAIVDETLEEAALDLELLSNFSIARVIRTIKTQETEPCE